MKFSTKAIHVGQQPDQSFGSIVPAMHLTTTYVQEAPAKFKGYDYTRAGNPNFSNIEATLAALEGGKFATVFSSGLGAMTALISTLKSGDHVIGIDDLYGGTYRIFKRVFEKFGVLFDLVNMRDAVLLEKALKKRPKMLILESPTNPLLKITDIRTVCEQAREYLVTTVIDNTFASPYFQRPLDLGADVSLHSSTKYIGGHSDVVGGVIVTNDQTLKEKYDFARMAVGLNPSPFDCWLLSRSVKTLALRMEKHQENALAVANFLQKHKKVKKVFYPGLPSHEGYEIARSQMSGFSGMVSVEFDLSLEESKRLISSFEIISLAESLGAVESLVDHPASMTHASIPAKERAKMGLSDGLVRFSVGCEDKEDLIQDLEERLAEF